MNTEEWERILLIPFPNFQDSDELYTSLLNVAQDSVLHGSPTNNIHHMPEDAEYSTGALIYDVTVDIPATDSRRFGVGLPSCPPSTNSAANNESSKRGTLSGGFALGPTAPSTPSPPPVRPLPFRSHPDSHRPRRPLLPGQSALRLDQVGTRIPSSDRSGSSRPVNTLPPTCQCPEKTRKPMRHWRTACPYNPEHQSMICPTCDRSFSRKDNCLRHMKGCRVEAQS